ncbi:MAG: hypothetical protein EXS58_12420 [Candidatus Latescibacteria bacterium]|nr:hypothetical protein [Candidatus Latescibacterota bacterium]
MKLWRSLVLVVLWAGAVFGGTPADEDLFIRKTQEYDNFSRTGYERYPLFPQSRPVYNRVGNYEGHGVYLMRWDEIREQNLEARLRAPDDVFRTEARSSVFADDATMRSEFGGLSMSHQGWQGRGATFFMGRGPTSTFSPLVFYQPDFSGVRADLTGAHQELSILLSRGGLWGRNLYADFNGNSSGVIAMSPVLLYGGNWRGRFGALQLGASFLRQVQSSIKGDRSSLYRGGLPYQNLQPPKQLIVRLSDDSPDDQEGMAVYGVQVFVRIKETGELRTGDAQAAAAGAVFDPLLQPQTRGRRVSDHWEAQGAAETVDFTFTLPAALAAESVQIAAQVSGDYHIGVRQKHDFLSPETGKNEERTWPSPSPLNGVNMAFKDNPRETEPFYTVVRAAGNPRLGGESKLVRFDHAIPTGQTFYGFNSKIDVAHFSLEGEMVANPQDFIFPTAGGDRVRRTAFGGFLKVRRGLGRLGGAGAEVFRLDPTYGGWYDSRRGGAVFFTDVAGDALGGEKVAAESLTQEFPLYADNDDHDRWPDDQVQDSPYVPQGAFRDPVYLGGRPESGTFPGLDQNGDRVYDMDTDRDGVGDWLEPFFAYEVDPPDFVYGVDFNNNGVPDFRENDAEPDYPYRRDRRGGHLFFDPGGRPTWLDRMTIGWYHLSQKVGGGRSRAIYARSRAHLTLGGVALGLADDFKQVKDDIPDDVYRFVLSTETGIFGRFNTSAYLPPPDPLLMRDSMVNTAFLETRYAPWRRLEVINNVKFTTNWRAEVKGRQGELVQDGRTLNNFTLVSKAEYRLQPVENLSLVARVKYLAVRNDAGSYNFSYTIENPADTLEANPKAAWSMFTPNLKARYRLTSKTSLEFGQAGFFLPALKARYSDFEHPAMGYTANLSVLQLTMSGDNQGYQVTTNLGVRWEQTSYDARALREDEDFSSFFIDVVFGVE